MPPLPDGEDTITVTVDDGLLNAPTLIKRGGAESGTFYIYDPENGEAVAVVSGAAGGFWG